MTATPITAVKQDIRMIPLAQLHESPLNTRQHFDPAKLAELATSMKTSGQLTPLLARPSKLHQKSGFELAAGHRRRRAAEAAGMTDLMVIVRDLDDRTFLEILTVDNLQREDVHPLEEAQGYRNLLTIDGYHPKQIADRVGKSESYVYDRLKLLQLIPELQELFFGNRFTLGHAILLARIPADDQKRAMKPPANRYGEGAGGGGLWQPDYGHSTLGLPDPKDEKGPYAALQPRSVRQLQQWIDENVRFDKAEESVSQLFPETAATIAQAEAAKEKIIEITHDYHVRPEAKDEDGARTYGPTSWKRADGVEDTKTCEYSVVGLIAVGEGRGDSFRVCVDKKRCEVHWGAEIKERNKRERARDNAPTSTSSPKQDTSAAAAQAKREAEAAVRKAEEARFEKAAPALLTAIGRALKSAPTSANSPLASYVWKLIEDGLWGMDNHSKKAAKYVPRGTNAGDFLRHVAMCSVVYDCDDQFNGANYLSKTVKDLKLAGVDVAKIVDAVAPRAEKKPEPKKPEPKKAVGKPSQKVGTTVATKKPAAKKATPAKKAAKKKRSPNAVFMAPLQPDAVLAAIVGDGPMPRTEITKKLWAYIKRHGLQDKKERRNINTDDKLKALFGGKSWVSMFDMTKLVNKHIQS